ncbi:hypothetical protein BDP81DRAFT_312884, partial [Colletotrichum phormii]
MSRRKRLTPQELERLCSYATPAGRCPYSRVTLTRDGNRYPSRFCKLHCCKKIDTNNAACLNMRTNNKGYCQQHLLCQGMMNDGRCNNYIKNYDPKEFRFCSQYHNCIQQGCANQRNHPNGTDYRYCPDHRCDHQDCTNPKSPPSSFCASHTCAAPSCLARCPGATGDAHDPSRHCDRHRMCATAGCRRFAHVNEHGVPSAHCGEHHCRFDQQPPCNNGRVAGTEGTCVTHTCEDRGCGRVKTAHMADAGGAAGRYCKRHECDREGCWERRWLGNWCVRHTCARRDCEREGGIGDFCDRHRICGTPGCERFRHFDGENVRDTCEERE